MIVVLSKSFISKNWPQRELNSALNIEASSGEVRVLPLIVGTEEAKKLILEKYPIINDKLFLLWDYDTSTVIDTLKSRLSITEPSKQEKPPTMAKSSFDIPLPEIKREFTQRDKDIFIKRSFEIIKSYFHKALADLQAKYPDVETDFIEIHRFKFICTIYVHGEVGSKCKIWVGGPLSSDSIAYQEGDFSIEADNSYNDWLTINEEGDELGFKILGMRFGLSHEKRDDILTAERGAEYFWRRLTEHLE